MPQSDYYIAFDSSGEHYIAHAWGKRGANQSHKYIAKIGEGPKARYFYTPEELRAFQMGGRQKAQNAVNTAKQKTANTVNKVKEKASDTAGRIRENSTLLNVGNQYSAAQRAHKNSKSSDPETAKWGKKGYEENNSLGGKAYKAQQKATEAVKSTAQKLNEKTKSTSDKMREEFKKTRENAKDETYAAISRLSGDKVFPEGPDDKSTQKEREIENGKSIVNKYLDKAENVSNKMKSTSDRMKEEFRKTKKAASDKVKDIAGVDERERRDKAVEKYEQSIKDKERASDVRDRAFKEEFEKTTFSDPNIGSRDKIYRDPPMTSEERSEYDRARQAADAANDHYKKMVKKETEAGKEARRAQDEYSKTILGQVDIAKKIAKDVQEATKEYSDSLRRQANNVKESAEDVIDTVISKTPAAKKKAKQEYESANETWEKAYDKAIKIQNERSELEYTSNGEKRSLTGNEYNRLIALRKEEEAAVDELRAATNKLDAAYHKAYGK